MSGKSTATDLAKALAHPLRVRILAEMERREQRQLTLAGLKRASLSPEQLQEFKDGPGVSPNALSGLLEEPLGNVSYHVKTLLEYGCVALTKTEPRRGAVEHFYRTTSKALAGTLEAGGITISKAQANLAGAAISDALALADAEDSELDGAGRTDEDRAELERLREVLLAA